MASTVKYDWYQTDTTVTITVLLKNAAEKNYSVVLEQSKILLTADGIEPIAINLWDAINAEQSSHKASPSKVEIKLAKLIGHRWEALEKREAVLAAPEPTVKKNQHDWDKISKEIEKQEEEDKPEVSVLFIVGTVVQQSRIDSMSSFRLSIPTGKGNAFQLIISHEYLNNRFKSKMLFLKDGTRTHLW